VFNPDQSDVDEDTFGDVCDNCPEAYNPTQDDFDKDGLGVACDNYPNQPNTQNLGTCAKIVGGVLIGTGATCLRYDNCNEDEYCDMVQGDCNGNGIGDAWECYADVNCSTKVDLADLVIMKAEFLRTDCATIPCNADCNGDYHVDLTDLVVMKTQFLRIDCPACP